MPKSNIFLKRHICLYTSFILRMGERRSGQASGRWSFVWVQYICILDIHIDNWHVFNFNWAKLGKNMKDMKNKQNSWHMCHVGSDLTPIKKSMTLMFTTFLNQYHLFFLNFILLGSQQFIGCFTAYLSSSK